MKWMLTLMICCTVFADDSDAQSQTVSPEQQLLSYFKGQWTVAGSENSYLEVCDWIQGNHIQCVSVSKEKEGSDSSISFLSYLAAEKKYVYYGLYSSGNSRTLKGDWINNKFLFEGKRITPGKNTRWKVTITPLKENLHFVEEFSNNEGPWEKRADFIYQRVK